MSPKRIALLLLLLTTAALPASTPVGGEHVIVAVDLSHGESDKYLNFITGNITFVEWRTIKEFNSASLSGAKLLLIGQPTVAFTPDEISALKSWFLEGGKAVWIAADSDYGPGVGYQDTANGLLEALGSRLRLDLCSAEDPVQNAKASYRVVANVDPDEPVRSDLLVGISKPVLYHGPGVLAYVKPDGSWASLEAEKPENVVRIVRTSPNGKIVENNPPAAKAHTAGQSGSLVLNAAEFVKVGDKIGLVIASGESPYGDYEPTWSSVYYGVDLDGPTFVTNMINFALKFETYYRIMELQNNISKLNAELTASKSKIDELSSKLKTQEDKAKTLEARVSSLEVERTNNLYMGLGGGVVVGLIIGAAIAYFATRKKGRET
ncbi:aminotransferase [Candidatus Bathyarchaeota archaeon]|nr:aminotransferase [Candidatus Bathyarchaeota archaeon]